MENARRALALRLATLCLGLLVVYAAFPTRSHYWDGIGFALNIEGVPQDRDGHDPDRHGEASAIYYNPNHLLFNAAGQLLYRAARTVLPGVRALDVLVAWSIAASVLTAALLYLTLLRVTRRERLSWWLTLLFASTATWWKFSTDASAYVPSTALLMAALWLALRPGTPPVFAIAVLHAAAMLLHQIAIWFYPAMWVALWLRHRPGLVAYTLGSASLVTAAYLAVWFGPLAEAADGVRFLRWITFNGGDVLTRQTVAGHFTDLLRGTVKVFFGGKLSLALRHTPPAMLAAAAAVAVAALVTAGRAWRRTPAGGAAGRVPAVALAWVGSFGVFLLFWLTEYPYYRLFCLPGFFIVLGACLGRRGEAAAPALVLLTATLNFFLYIYPYSRPEATPPLQVALAARGAWTGVPATVYYKEFNCDNWWLKYFNMQTRWRRANPEDPAALLEQARQDAARGHRVFVDTGVLTHWEQAPELLDHLQGEFDVRPSFGLSNGKHHIRLAELQPVAP